MLLLFVFSGVQCTRAMFISPLLPCTDAFFADDLACSYIIRSRKLMNTHMTWSLLNLEQVMQNEVMTGKTTGRAETDTETYGNLHLTCYGDTDDVTRVHLGNDGYRGYEESSKVTWAADSQS